MADWQSGDLALCVKSSEDSPANQGCVYTVDKVWTSHPGVVFTLTDCPPAQGYSGFVASAFIKVTPPADMVEEHKIEEVSA